MLLCLALTVVWNVIQAFGDVMARGDLCASVYVEVRQHATCFDYNDTFRFPRIQSVLDLLQNLDIR